MRARVTNYAGYSKYRVEIDLPRMIASGKFKVRTVHADGDHAKTVSSFSAVRDM